MKHFFSSLGVKVLLSKDYIVAFLSGYLVGSIIAVFILTLLSQYFTPEITNPAITFSAILAVIACVLKLFFKKYPFKSSNQ